MMTEFKEYAVNNTSCHCEQRDVNSVDSSASRLNDTISEVIRFNSFANDDKVQKKSSDDVPFCVSFPTISFGKLCMLVMALLTLSDRKYSLISQRNKNIFPRSNTLFSSILPLTNDVDSCRTDDESNDDEYWKLSAGWLRRLQSTLFGELESNNSLNMTGAFNNNFTSTRFVQRSHVMTLSSTTPFVLVQDIADLTLDEVGEIMRYAMISGKRDFDRNSFYQRIRLHLREVINSLDSAVAKSRGDHLGECMVQSMSDVSIGQIDALKFAAALRIFAEWRTLRQVPEGYKGYAVGMSLGYKDVVQNIVKIEDAVHSWIDYHSMGNSMISCGPTLRQLLEYESVTGTHRNLPRLIEKSGAMGVLWIYRQLQYQSHIFSNILQVPHKFANTEEGVKAAYKDVFDRYHGWAIQQIFTYSFKAAPKSDEILKQMNPRKLEELQMTSCNTENKNNTSNQGLGMDPLETFIKKIEGTWNDFSFNFAKGFDEVVTNIVKIVNKDHVSKFQKDIIIPAAEAATYESGSCNENSIMQGIVDTAREQIGMFLDDVAPLIDMLSTVLTDMNMDDPSKI